MANTRSTPTPFMRFLKVAIAEEALRRANAAGNLPAEAGRQAAEERVETIRKEAKAARTKRATLAKRAVPAVASAATDRMSQVSKGTLCCDLG